MLELLGPFTVCNSHQKTWVWLAALGDCWSGSIWKSVLCHFRSNANGDISFWIFWRVLKWSLLHLLCARTTWFRVWHARMHGVDSVRLGWLFTSSGEFLPQGIFWSLFFCPFRMYLNWDITSIEKHSLIYVFFFVLWWARLQMKLLKIGDSFFDLKKLVFFAQSNLYWSLFRCRIYTNCFFLKSFNFGNDKQH